MRLCTAPIHLSKRRFNDLAKRQLHIAQRLNLNPIEHSIWSTSTISVIKLDGSMYFAMINSLAPTIGNMEEPVNEWVVKNQLDGNEDLWEDEEWGFYEDLSFKDDFEDESDTFDEDMTQTNFKSIDVAFEDVSKLALSEAEVFFDAAGKEISKDEFKKQLKSEKEFVLSVCQCSPNG